MFHTEQREFKILTLQMVVFFHFSAGYFCIDGVEGINGTYTKWLSFISPHSQLSTECWYCVLQIASAQ